MNKCIKSEIRISPATLMDYLGGSAFGGKSETISNDKNFNDKNR